MDKMILVMDDPIFCCNCPLAKSRKHNITKEEIWICGIAQKDEYDYFWNPVDMDSDTKPDWCPLISTPEKKLPYITSSDHLIGFGEGYNACVDEILGN